MKLRQDLIPWKFVFWDAALCGYLHIHYLHGVTSQKTEISIHFHAYLNRHLLSLRKIPDLFSTEVTGSSVPCIWTQEASIVSCSLLQTVFALTWPSYLSDLHPSEGSVGWWSELGLACPVNMSAVHTIAGTCMYRMKQFFMCGKLMTWVKRCWVRCLGQWPSMVLVRATFGKSELRASSWRCLLQKGNSGGVLFGFVYGLGL
jgi:hypothetical protein